MKEQHSPLVILAMRPGRTGCKSPRASGIFLVTLASLLLVANTLAAFDAVGTINSIDAERNVVHIHANGRDRDVTVARDAQIFGMDGKPLADGLKANEFKAGAEVTLTVEKGDGGPVVRVIRLGRQNGNPAQNRGKTSIGLKPLNEITAEDRYKEQDGGLYGGGRNEPPPAHLAAARGQTARIIPLDTEGRPSKNGRIGLVSISMSNATQEYSLFKQIADRDPKKSPLVDIVDCAQGGQAMAEWRDPNARAWTEADRRLETAKVSPKQVQVIWVKLANKGPHGDLAEHGKKLQKDTLAVLQNAKSRFPNLRIAYLGSRIYGGYATTPLNPEPYAYEGAFVVRGLIQDQINGDPELVSDDSNGTPKVPLLLWGPYFWADGIVLRKSDGLVWERKDLAGDGTHPSNSGRQKVAEMLLKFFKEDPLASTWFVEKVD